MLPTNLSVQFLTSIVVLAVTHPTVIVRRSPPDHGPMVLLVHVLHSSKAPRGKLWVVGSV